MIKLIGVLTMIIDHVAAFFFERFTAHYIISRMIGRLSMPIFGYCIARGFYYSRKNNKIKKYFKNLTIFALISQIPICFVPYGLYGRWNIRDFYLNIGFTWLISLSMLTAIIYLEKKEKEKEIENRNKTIAVFVILALAVISFLIPVEYGLYAVLFPVIFYFFAFRTENPFLCFISSILIYFIYVMKEKGEFFNFGDQILSIFSVFIIFALQKHDKILRLPKRFFYWFYPIHLAIFELIKCFFFMKK